MLAAQTEGLEEALAYGGNRNPNFTQAVVNHGVPDRGMRRGFVLDDFQRPQTGALVPASTEV